MLTELEHDALTELVNIAVSGAAVRLRGMVGSEVSLTVPAVAVVGATDAAQTMENLGLASFMAVRQSFSGRLDGQTLLVFPAENYNDLVRAVVGDDVSEEEFQGLAADALGEIGNVLLVGFLSTIGNMLRIDFEVSLPQVATGRPEEIFDGGEQQAALFIYVNFGVKNRSLRGYFALVFGVSSFLLLKDILARFIQQVSTS